MTLLVVVVLLAAFLLIIGGAVLVRSRRGSDLEPPLPGVLTDRLDAEAGRNLLTREEQAEAEASTHPLVADPGVVPPVVVTPEEAAAVEAEALAALEASEAPPIQVPEAPAPEAPVRPRIRDRLGKARGLLSGYFGSVLSRSTIDEGTWEEIEEALIRADVGVSTTGVLLDSLRQRVKSESLDTPGQLLEALKEQLKADLQVTERRLHLEPGGTNVWLFVGVNGVGKTTTIGKLGLRQAAEGHRIVMAAGDTFRAAAAEQLELWAHRVGADLVRGAEGGDPGSVVFDAVQRAAARGADLVLADTAGRLHTKVNLMEELKKVHRVAQREPGVVSEVLLVIDATTGQNGLTQAREFADAVGVTGVVLTKLDGTAKGGIVLAIQSELGIPVKLVGVGEAAEDLVDFDPEEFVDALFAA
jgi:fused signal recognition particle receptor